MRLLYNLSLAFLFILFLPKLLIDFFLKKKYRQSLLPRLLPKKITGKEVIWLHGVSLGETKALSTLIPHIRKTYPDAFLLITTVTETGQAIAKTIPDIDSVAYLPFDFSWIIKPFVKWLRPKLLILVEGDYWLNLLTAVKKQGGKTIVVNGKLSHKSLKRYLHFPPFTRALFSSIDHYCLQGESYLKRFTTLGISPEKLTITGNLKLDIPITSSKTLDFPLTSHDTIITLGSTHEGEESLLLKALMPLLNKDPHLKVLVVPRHPERFKKVKASIHHPQVTVVDQMGILPTCYSLSHIAIVGGSFVKGIGGHDIFEPTKMGVPTLFGPHMEAQKEFAQDLVAARAALKVAPEKLSSILEKLLTDKSLRVSMSEKGKSYAQQVSGTSLRTWKTIQKNFSLERKSLTV